MSREVLHVAFPDENAAYWVLPYALGANDTIEVSGTYPSARYFSLITYGTDLDTTDTLRDDQLLPDLGSGNPFSDPGAQGLPPDRRRLQGRRSQPCAQPFDPRTLPGPIADAGQWAVDRAIERAASGAFRTATPEAAFVNPASTSGLFPNGDNKCIGAVLTYQPGRIAVVRGRAPAFPDTSAGAPPTESGQQVRYWSICENDLVSPYPVVACAGDFETALDADGTDPATTMGAYYPTVVYCSAATFAVRGYVGCVVGDRS